MLVISVCALAGTGTRIGVLRVSTREAYPVFASAWAVVAAGAVAEAAAVPGKAPPYPSELTSGLAVTSSGTARGEGADELSTTCTVTAKTEPQASNVPAAIPRARPPKGERPPVPGAELDA